jgi:FAD/FMN-containing dehydrogenase/Fe-S oxidoreductase
MGKPEEIRGLLQRELAPRVDADFRYSQHERLLFATDASIYQVEPLAVVHPRNVAQVPVIARFCSEHGIALLPRGGGTSLPGQCVNEALVVDYSPTCRSLLEVAADGAWCRVEPGIVLDDLNRLLTPRGVFFAPDPATAAQCAIGGCIGNNAAGARSIRYGRTSENVLELKVCLADGRVTTLGRGAGRHDAVALELARQTAALVQQHGGAIRERFPNTSRRNAGYALDLVLQQLQAGVGSEDLDLTGLLCGSEGTLGITLEAKLKLHPLPRAKGLAIISFPSLEESIEAVQRCLDTGCTAVELIDDVVLEAARGNNECRRYMDLLPDVAAKPPAAVLYVEYQEQSAEAVQSRFAQLREVLRAIVEAGRASMREYVDASALLRAWALRKAGEPLLHGLGGHRKPLTCVEDNAVPVENLARFVKGFKEIVQRHGTRAAYWAHASVGVLHVRPMLNLHDAADREHFRAIAQEVARWAQECGGVMSGEHGDGRLRGPLLREFFGEELMRAFRECKRIFDPAGVLNPGIIAEPGPVESLTERLRILPEGRPLAYPQVETYFDYDEGLGEAAEICSGAGGCRKSAGGTMCPSYRATLDERHSTRGRANALRLAMSGQLAKVWDDPETLETLHLCLSCKACKSECPSNVDVARLKAEYLAQSYRAAGRKPLAAKAFGRVRALSRLGSAMPGMANALMGLAPVRVVLEKVLGIDRRRSMPRYERSLYRQLPGTGSADARGTHAARVVLFPDCFMTYNEPRIGLAAAEVLQKLGYEVILPKTGCCGRSLISTGLLDEAISAADEVLAQLREQIEDDDVAAIVVAEPSCLSAFKDDYLQLKCKAPLLLRQKLAAKAMLIEEFVEEWWEKHPVRPAPRGDGDGRPVLLHAHCHQKSLWTAETSAKLLRRLCGPRLRVLDTGCCGLAGSFGFTADRYELSMKIGELSLLPLVREAPADAIIVAPGTSCRHQIHDGAARQALHPIELVRELL